MFFSFFSFLCSHLGLGSKFTIFACYNKKKLERKRSGRKQIFSLTPSIQPFSPWSFEEVKKRRRKKSQIVSTFFFIHSTVDGGCKAIASPWIPEGNISDSWSLNPVLSCLFQANSPSSSLLLPLLLLKNFLSTENQIAKRREKDMKQFIKVLEMS